MTLIVGHLASDTRLLRLAVASVLILFLVGLGVTSSKLLLYGLVIWLASLGVLRRLLSEIAPIGSVDPLLLVGPIALLVLMLTATESGAFQRLTALSKAVLILSIAGVISVFNPLQGSVMAGFGGLLFFVVPMLAFWTGRVCPDQTLERVLKLVAVLAIPAALYGLAQTFNGFPSWDASWIAERGYAALNVGGVIRPFGTFSSAAEYGFFLAIAAVVWAVVALKSRHVLVCGGIVSLLVVALFYEASRVVVVLLVLALVVVLCASRRVPLIATVAIAVAVLASVPFVASRLIPEDPTATSGSTLLSHQATGLANPLDPESSTLRVHLALVEEGLRSGIANPLGVGVGAVSIAASRFGGSGQGTEADPSNVAVSLGIPGLLVYLFILFVGTRRAYETATKRADLLSLAALGILIATLSQWLNGGQYAVAFLPWLILGWLDRASNDIEESRRAELSDSQSIAPLK